jgi:hypothetical protein
LVLLKRKVTGNSLAGTRTTGTLPYTRRRKEGRKERRKEGRKEGRNEGDLSDSKEIEERIAHDDRKISQIRRKNFTYGDLNRNAFIAI